MRWLWNRNITMIQYITNVLHAALYVITIQCINSIKHLKKIAYNISTMPDILGGYLLHLMSRDPRPAHKKKRAETCIRFAKCSM